MPARSPFEYTVLRVVPSIEREEFVNAGVILFCKEKRFLGARVHLDTHRLLSLEPQADLLRIKEHLALAPLIVDGGPEAGELGKLSPAERFRWLASPRNTVVQPSPVHPGLCENPQAALDHIFSRLVLLKERT